MKEATSKRRKDRHTPYLQRVKEALSRSLLKMEPYEEEKYIQKVNTKILRKGKSAGTHKSKLPFYPHVELGTALVEVEHIEDRMRIRHVSGSDNMKIVTPHDSNFNNAFGDHTTRINAAKRNAAIDIKPVCVSKEPFSTSTASSSTTQSSGMTRKRISCLIESTRNSVRVSFLFKAQANATGSPKVDPLEASILFQWMRFLMVKEHHPLLRKKPVDGYSVTFLITNWHLATHGRERVEDSILNFCAEIDKECSEIKLKVNAQARYITTEFLKGFNNRITTELGAEG